MHKEQKKNTVKYLNIRVLTKIKDKGHNYGRIWLLLIWVGLLEVLPAICSLLSWLLALPFLGTSFPGSTLCVFTKASTTCPCAHPRSAERHSLFHQKCKGLASCRAVDRPALIQAVLFTYWFVIRGFCCSYYIYADTVLCRTPHVWKKY